MGLSERDADHWIGITISGQSGYVGYSPDIGGVADNIAVVNQGTIQADVSGGTITMYGTGDQNSGTLEALNGATLSLEGSNWEDSGVNYADATSRVLDQRVVLKRWQYAGPDRSGDVHQRRDDPGRDGERGRRDHA